MHYAGLVLTDVVSVSVRCYTEVWFYQYRSLHRTFGVNPGVTPEIYRHFTFCIN